MELVNGKIVNEFDELIGTYKYICENMYCVELYGCKAEMSRKTLQDKVDNLELCLVPIWD